MWTAVQPEELSERALSSVCADSAAARTTSPQPVASGTGAPVARSTCRACECVRASEVLYTESEVFCMLL